MDIFERLKDRFKAPSERTVLELGAHDGGHTPRILSCFNGDVQYVAFEPDNRNVEKLLKHPLVTSLKVKLVPLAVSSKAEVATFYMSDSKSNPGWSQSSSLLKPTLHLKKHPWVQFPEQDTVATTTLDIVASALSIDDRVDFMWMDVQGAEHLVFAGGQETLRKTQWIYTEFSDVPYYEGQVGLEGLLKLLPGNWEVVENYGEDVLLNNLWCPARPEDQKATT